MFTKVGQQRPRTPRALPLGTSYHQLLPTTPPPRRGTRRPPVLFRLGEEGSLRVCPHGEPSTQTLSVDKHAPPPSGTPSQQNVTPLQVPDLTLAQGIESGSAVQMFPGADTQFDSVASDVQSRQGSPGLRKKAHANAGSCHNTSQHPHIALKVDKRGTNSCHIVCSQSLDLTDGLNAHSDNTPTENTTSHTPYFMAIPPSNSKCPR